MSKPPLPTPAEMRRFAARFSDEDYQFLCGNPGFMDTITTDLPLCGMIAERVLSERRRKATWPAGKEMHPNSQRPR